MKKLVIASALLVLTGCAAQVDNYSDVVKSPAPAGLAGYWQSKGPQSATASPDVIASLIITKDGDTLDCRQWVRVTTVPGQLMMRDGDVYNVTTRLNVYPLDHDGNTLSYDRMTLERVARPTPECADALAKKPLATPLP